ncbi:MAG TPA: hypothetical protein VG204_22065 [Terriglobia bacterium]|nr:hypothetical protein [Terriglobia bacterium]
MKSIRNMKFLNQVALVTLALCFSARLGNAQGTYKGEFTLSFEAVELGETFEYGVPRTKAKAMAQKRIPVRGASSSATGK